MGKKEVMTGRIYLGFARRKSRLSGILGLLLSILITSCASAQLGPAVEATPTLRPAEVSLNRNDTPTFVPTPVSTGEIEPGSSAPSSPVLTPTLTRLDQSTSISPVPTLEPTPAATASATETVTSPPQVEASPTIAPTVANLNQATLPPPTSTSEPLVVATDSPEVQLINLINQERTSRGLSVLTVDPRLTAAAQAHSQDMAQHNFFDHIGSDGSNPGDRITRQGYQWMFFAENLACEYFTPEEVVQAWLKSPGHRANMLAAQPEHIGIGLAANPGADCTPYWTAVFAAGG